MICDHEAHLGTTTKLPTGEIVQLMMPLTVWCDFDAMTAIMRVLGGKTFPNEKAWLAELANIIDDSEHVTP